MQQNGVEITHKERERIKARERQLELELSLSENTREEILSKLQSTHRTIKVKLSILIYNFNLFYF